MASDLLSQTPIKNIGNGSKNYTKYEHKKPQTKWLSSLSSASCFEILGLPSLCCVPAFKEKGPVSSSFSNCSLPAY
eukprot:2632007-Rhodomonas_salina.1